jgi:integrase/recombinase XerD
MLERHFRSLRVIDRIRAQWLGPHIERYAQSLDELHTGTATVRQHIRALGHFNEFVVGRGVQRLDELPDHVDAFVSHWFAEHGKWCKSAQDRATIVSQSRLPVERMLCLVLLGFTRPSCRPSMPFCVSTPGFFPFLLNEKGLRQATLHKYTYTLRPFESYLAQTGITLSALTPASITDFINTRAKTLHKSGMLGTTGALRAFLAYLHREGIIANDLTRSLPRGRAYRQASIPRAISWPDVERLLASVDCRSDVGKRDYAILTLLASYGLRAREIAALCLDDIDWVHEQISIPMRKGGHSTRYPLSATVGEAIIAYLHIRRTDIAMTHTGVSCMVSGRMHSIGIQVARAGSHTLRHACVQHLVEADLPFKVIGDYVGHRHPASTLVYGKVAVHKLREMVLAQGEDVL